MSPGTIAVPALNATICIGQTIVASASNANSGHDIDDPKAAVTCALVKVRPMGLPNWLMLSCQCQKRPRRNKLHLPCRSHRGALDELPPAWTNRLRGLGDWTWMLGL